MSARTTTSEAATRSSLDRAMLVTIAFPDLVLRLADRAISVPWSTSADGEPLFFYSGLLDVPEIEQAIDRFGGGAVSSLSLSLSFSGDTIDVAGLMSTDRWPQAARVEVALVWPDQDFTARTVVLADARCSRFAAYPDSGAVSMEVAREDEAESAYIGDDTNTIGSLTSLLPTYDQGLLDATMSPQVLGRVRHVPAIRLHYNTIHDYLLIAGHPIDSTQSITIEEDGQAISAGATTYDAPPIVAATNTKIEGNKGSGSVGGATWDPDAVSDPTHFPGGLTVSVMTGKRDRGRTILGLGRLLEYLLRQSGVPVDWGRMRRAIRMGDGWDVGLYVDKQVQALELVRSRLLPTSPLTEQRSENGIWYAWADPTNERPAAHLVEGQHWHRSGPRTSVAIDARNDFTMRFRYHYYYERYMSVARINRYNSAVCAHSWSTFGTRPAEPIEATHIYRPATAWASLRWIARQRALPRSTVEGLLDPSLYWLDAGDPILLTDAALGIDARLAVVASRNTANPAACTFEIIEQLPSQRSA